MEKDYIPSDLLMNLQLTSEKNVGTHYHENFELLYVLDGELLITIEKTEYTLKNKDIVIVNNNRKHNYVGSKDIFIARFVISYNKVKELLGKDTVLFWCNSSTEKNHSYDELRKILNQILNQHVISNNQNNIYTTSLHYSMLHTITKNFLIKSEHFKNNDELTNVDRMQEIFQYIRSNYQKNISLNELANQFFLSTAYLSKYIKKESGISFTELLNSVRLSHAMIDLLYSDSSVMKIAMDNGFASVAAYNKAFKLAYGETPSQYRKIKKIQAIQQDSEKNSNKVFMNNSEKKRLKTFLNGEPMIESSLVSKDHDVFVNIHENSNQIWQQNYNSLINGGAAFDLLQSEFQEHILYMKRELGAQWVRLWDIYAPELYLDINAPKQHLNFSRLNSVIDFLVSNDLKPYLELGFKPIRILKNTQEALVEIERDQEFSSNFKREAFYEALLQHLIKRYGSANVKEWFFEFWKPENIVFSDLKYSYSPHNEKVHEEYFDEFESIAKVMKKILPDIKVGGGGFPVQHYGTKEFSELLTIWKKYEVKPDFITITSYPYQLEKESNIYYEKKSTDMDFMKHNIETVEVAMKEAEFPHVPIHVTEYSLTLSNRNEVNDHVAKGAYLIKNAISTIGKADMFGHWLGTDRYSNFLDSDKLLFGGSGLLSETGVRKPAFHALSYLNMLYSTIIYRDDNFFITKNSRNSLKIICHNFKNFNYNYYLMDENDINISILPQLFEDRENLKFRLKVNGLENGTYMIKTSLVNQNNGSIQDEWQRFNQAGELTFNEQEYLKRISIPKLLSNQINVEANQLDLSINLRDNEFRYLHIFMTK